MRRGEGEREQEGGQGYSARSLGTRAFANCLGLPSVWLLLSHAPPLHFTSPASLIRATPRQPPSHVRTPSTFVVPAKFSQPQHNRRSHQQPRAAKPQQKHGVLPFPTATSS